VTAWNPVEERAVREFATERMPTQGCGGWKVLDVGGRVVNQFSRDSRSHKTGRTVLIRHGARAVFELLGCTYTCMDISNGTNVDIVQEAGQPFPFADATFDVVITVSVFEHDPMYWVTLREMARVARMGGYVYVNSPSTGKYHAWPGDCWRHIGDSGAALALWCGASYDGAPAYPLRLLEARFDHGTWHESVSVFRRTDTPATALTIAASGLPCSSGSVRTSTCRTNNSAPLAASEDAFIAIERFAQGLPRLAAGSAGRVLLIDPGTQRARLQALFVGRGYTLERLDGPRPGAPFPIPDGHFDVSVATAVNSDALHWMTVREMARTTRLGGRVFVFSASGPYKQHPSSGDYVRYYADAGAALAFWCSKPFGSAPPYPLALTHAVSRTQRLEEGLTMVFSRSDQVAPWFTNAGLVERGLLLRRGRSWSAP
jgi:SAM-dependent methyltransferase